VSRSHKKRLVYKDNSVYGKKQANRKIRRLKLCINGNIYRRYYPQWDISDYCFVCYINKKPKELEQSNLKDFYRK